jgi:hypothetical protein
LDNNLLNQVLVRRLFTSLVMIDPNEMNKSGSGDLGYCTILRRQIHTASTKLPYMNQIGGEEYIQDCISPHDHTILEKQKSTPKLYKAHRSIKFLKTKTNLPKTLLVLVLFDNRTEPRRSTSICVTTACRAVPPVISQATFTVSPADSSETSRSQVFCLSHSCHMLTP